MGYGPNRENDLWKSIFDLQISYKKKRNVLKRTLSKEPSKNVGILAKSQFENRGQLEVLKNLREKNGQLGVGQLGVHVNFRENAANSGYGTVLEN